MAKPKTGDILEQRLGYLLQRAASAAMASLGARLAQLELRQVDASVLMLIDEEPSIIASHIGRTLGIHGANMVPLMRALEERELIVRKPLDKKSHGLHLTDKGTQTLAEVRAILDQFEEDLESLIPARRRTATAESLRAIWRAHDMRE